MPGSSKRVSQQISPKTIGRLIGYRRIVSEFAAMGSDYVFSHEISLRSGASAAQVRRDLMAIGYSGIPKRGYEASSLVKGLDAFLNVPKSRKAVLIGVGNLGRALLAYFSGKRSDVSIEAAFDVDGEKIGVAVEGCRCYALSKMPQIIKKLGVRIGIMTVPAGAAQDVAEQLVDAGITGILNFAPVALSVPENVFMEDLDVGMSLEKIAFFAASR